MFMTCCFFHWISDNDVTANEIYGYILTASLYRQQLLETQSASQVQLLYDPLLYIYIYILNWSCTCANSISMNNTYNSLPLPYAIRPMLLGPLLTIPPALHCIDRRPWSRDKTWSNLCRWKPFFWMTQTRSCRMIWSLWKQRTGDWWLICGGSRMTIAIAPQASTEMHKTTYIKSKLPY